MFIVKTYVDKSTIEGLGVFSSDQIKKGETVWTFDPTFDRQFTPEQVANFPKTARDHILKCGFLDKDKGVYYLGIDYDIFSNHSNDPSLTIDTSKPNLYTDPLVAARDIMPGEELTQNYHEYDEAQDIKAKLSL